MEEKEFNTTFAIPANYTDSGKIFGGMLEPRNAVEASLLSRGMNSGERATASAVSLSRSHRARHTVSILWRSGTPSAQRWS